MYVYIHIYVSVQMCIDICVYGCIVAEYLRNIKGVSIHGESIGMYEWSYVYIHNDECGYL
jgi:hypothetical protein